MKDVDEAMAMMRDEATRTLRSWRRGRKDAVDEAMKDVDEAVAEPP